MARLTAVALWWCAWTVAAWEAGKKTGQDGWLDDHNYYRCLHGADPVGWDYTLESQAQAVANAMPPMAHSDSYNAGMPAGENLAMGMGTFTCGDYTGPYNQNCATHNWYEEVECWGFGDDGWKYPSCTIGHLTAMIWKKTTKIGCASNGNYFVCQYGAEPPNFNSGSCPTNECVERKNYDEAGCKAGTSNIVPTGSLPSVPGLGGNKGAESGVLWKGLLAWAVVSVICFAIFGADAAGKYHICESSEAAAAKPAGGAPPAGDGAVEEQPGIELAATSEA